MHGLIFHSKMCEMFSMKYFYVIKINKSVENTVRRYGKQIINYIDIGQVRIQIEAVTILEKIKVGTRDRNWIISVKFRLNVLKEQS